MDLVPNPAVNDVLTLDLPDLAAMHDLAVRLAKVIRGGDLIALRGELGIGKSELARALIRARAGMALEVPSPTFTIVQDYALKGLTIRHIDLYRIDGPEELVELGLNEAPGDDEAWLVEWLERSAGRIAGARLDMVLEAGASADARVAHITGDASWTSRLGTLADV